MTEARSRLEDDLQTVRDLSLFVAYNANVDAVIRVDESLEAALEPPAGDPGTTAPPDRLASKSDLATAIAHAMAAGEGDQGAMTADLADELEAKLRADAMQMGGQAGIMTNLLSTLAASPVVYTYLLSETQRSMFDRPERIRFPLVEDGEVRFASLDDAPTAERTKINWIFEFREGAEFFGVRATGNTRFIAASRPPEFDLHAGELDAVIDQVGDGTHGALLAGYHNLTPENVEAGYDRTLRHARDVLRRLRSEREFPVHVEYAVTHDDELRRSVTETILPEANVVGLDPHELSLLREDLNLAAEPADEGDGAVGALEEASLEDESPERSIVAHYRTLVALRDRLGVDCVRMHAMHYHLAVMDDYLPPEAVERGLEFAAVNAATKAATGHIDGPEALETGLEYEPSTAGKRAVESLADAVDATAEDGVLATPSVVACPNRVVDDPAGTVGIGDIVSAASFALEVGATVEDAR
ncbi:ADP-dependent phosphofructokinase/glucokinase [Halogeometricum rufum]|uniref:ADP-dependent phosphofructokinase/glucokinase n=1 Tax=Halogeometricum rufum TaxID=553469 RepID=A0A1I6IGS1_9EURY|nr:ADP-dependent glucokinase/phosphofructokinase [Halogeometricum rufum]SFR65849.1 ADP-dependent phosphofructokinase/glucokinase [Halogeometricum rufum]